MSECSVLFGSVTRQRSIICMFCIYVRGLLEKPLKCRFPSFICMISSWWTISSRSECSWLLTAGWWQSLLSLLLGSCSWSSASVCNKLYVNDYVCLVESLQLSILISAFMSIFVSKTFMQKQLKMYHLKEYDSNSLCSCFFSSSNVTLMLKLKMKSAPTQWLKLKLAIDSIFCHWLHNVLAIKMMTKSRV